MATKFGTLATVSTYAAGEYQAGCRRAMQEIKWDSYETSQNTYSPSYIQSQQSLLSTLQNASNSTNDLVLSLGIHYPPGWISSISPAPGNFTNQNGLVSSAANIVFSASVRSAVSAYLTRVNSDLGLNNYAQIRIASGGNSNGELLYPQETSNGSATYTWWCYDNAAQTGTGLASGQTVCPYPGWIPGSYNNGVTTTAQVTTWINWYIQSLTNTAQWFMDQLNSLGFTGTYALLMPGQGVHPDGLSALISNKLAPLASGTGYVNVTNNLLCAGPVWQAMTSQLAGLSYLNRIGLHCSSTGDGSGGDDYTLPTDITNYGSNPLSAATEAWSAARWITFLANVYGFKMGGENTGFPGSGSFNTHYKDSTNAGLMAKAIAQAKNGNWLWYDWAHSTYLHYSGATYGNVQYIANYQNYIQTVNVPASPLKYYHLQNSGTWKRLGT